MAIPPFGENDDWRGRFNPDPVPSKPSVAPEAAAALPPAAGGGRGSGGGGGAFGPSGKPHFNFPGVPLFDAPGFEPPDPNKLSELPGYNFRLSQGQEGIERSAAAKGLLRTGGTLKDISEYNQNFASNEYSNEFNRALQTYSTNYQGLRDEYAPLFAQWQMLSGAELQAALAAYNRDTVWRNPHGGRGGGGGGGPFLMPPPQRNSDVYGGPADYGRY